MSKRIVSLVALAIAAAAIALAVTLQTQPTPIARAEDNASSPQEQLIDQNATAMVGQGRQIFRYSTFGDESFWGDTLRLHEAIEGAPLGGVGQGVSPKTALSVGLKVDMDRLPAPLVEQIKAGKVDLGAPATTLALLKLAAVVGVKGFFYDDASDSMASPQAAAISHKGLRSIGITCA